MFKKFKDEVLDLSAEIKPLISKIGLTSSELGVGIVTFIAARRGEGTSTVARSFAMTYGSETGKKTLLIECGGNDNNVGNGIVELASAGSDIGAATSAIGNGAHVASWYVTIQGKTLSGRMVQDKALWQALGNEFEAIIIDAPSLQESSEGASFAQISTMTVIVVEAESTRREVVNNLRNTLEAVGAKIGGVVLNKRKFYIPEKVYKKL